uniref:Uncharacterized protein n=1 Tax=Avena sativa TaxID=4498 RepID=A0ACD5YV38_AVESA
MYPEFEVEEEHQLPFLCYEQYITTDGALFAHGCMHLDQFVLTRYVSLTAPWTGNRDDIDEDIEIPGEAGTHTVASEAGKKIIRTMFEAVWCIAKTGRCFQTIERKHVFVGADGNVRLLGVRILDPNNILQLGPQLRQNLIAVAGIGRDLFNERGLGIPAEFTHLFDMVDNDAGTMNFELYHVHTSGVPIGIGWLVYQKLFDHVMVQISRAKRLAIYRSLRPYMQNWRVIAESNDLSKSTFVFRQGSYDLNDARVAAIMGIDLNQFLSKPLVDQQDMWLLAEAHMFMMYLRNRSAHRLGGMDVDSYYKKNGGKDYTPEGSDYLFQIRWADVMCHIQKELSDLGELADLKISHFFSGLYSKKI